MSKRKIAIFNIFIQALTSDAFMYAMNTFSKNSDDLLDEQII